jgi:hypothetical protein
MEEKMYPQYGDLHSAMFRQTRHPELSLLHKSRAELMAREKGCGGVQTPQRRNKDAEVVAEQCDKTMEYSIKEHLKMIQDQKRVHKEVARRERKIR